MTQLLVSVRDVEEAMAALASGADIIDVKEPLHGSLGAASASTIRDVVASMSDRVPVSAALGELLEPDRHLSQCELPASLSYVKVGLAECAQRAAWPDLWKQFLSSVPHCIERAAVGYADWRIARAPAPIDVVHSARSAGCTAILIDTFCKSGNDLFDVLSNSELNEISDCARREGLILVLAGSLTLESIPHALQFRPDVIAVRGAACVGSRAGKVESRRVRELKGILQHARQHMESPARIVAG